MGDSLVSICSLSCNGTISMGVAGPDDAESVLKPENNSHVAVSSSDPSRRTPKTAFSFSPSL